ncbi:MAG: hypothetical protein MZW92_38910 [Comamonadaceae bacterium]|nr:hypothetical protein [Comamonadaceae bacterium]
MAIATRSTPTIRDGMLYGRGAVRHEEPRSPPSSSPPRSSSRAHPAHRRIDRPAAHLGRGRPGDRRHGAGRRARCRRAASALDYCIVGEPTSVDALGDTIKNGRRGSLSGQADASRACRATSPTRTSRSNPVHLAGAGAGRAGARATWDDGNELFPPTTFQVSNIHAGTGAQQRDPRHLRGRLQPALRAGIDAPRA